MTPERAMAHALTALGLVPAPPTRCADCRRPMESLLEYEMLPGERGDADVCRRCWEEMTS